MYTWRNHFPFEEKWQQERLMLNPLHLPLALSTGLSNCGTPRDREVSRAPIGVLSHLEATVLTWLSKVINIQWNGTKRFLRGAPHTLHARQLLWLPPTTLDRVHAGCFYHPSKWEGTGLFCCTQWATLHGTSSENNAESRSNSTGGNDNCDYKKIYKYVQR